MAKLYRYELLENYMKERGLTKTNFCKICKISFETLKKIENNQLNLRIFAFIKIANATGIHAKYLFEPYVKGKE